MELPTIAILFMTKEVPGREGVARKTIESLNLNLSYGGEHWFCIADGGSSEEYLLRLFNTIGKDSPVIGTLTPGGTWNRAIQSLYEHTNIYLRMEDDFLLRDPLDITPYVKLLMEKEQVGMVRLGLMPIGLDLHSTAHDGRIYFNVKKSTPYQYSGNPALIHKRLHDAHGYFNETMDPGQIEVEFDNRIRAEEGPEIWMPWDLGGYENTYGIFNHIGEVKSYE